jgi:hypothetical protein
MREEEIVKRVLDRSLDLKHALMESHYKDLALKDRANKANNY